MRSLAEIARELPPDATFDTSEKPDPGPTYSSDVEGLREAAAVSRSERKDEEQAEEQPEPTSLENGAPVGPLVEIEYLDKKNAPEEVSMRQAGKDLAAWREAQRQSALADLVGDDVPQPPAPATNGSAQPEQPQPTEQPSEPTLEQMMQASWQKAEYVRRQYEDGLAVLMQSLQATVDDDFSDIKTMADVSKMAEKDWQRYVKWDANQKQLAAVRAELQSTAERRSIELAHKWGEFSKAQDAKAAELIPELRNPAERDRLQSESMAVLQDLGLSHEEIRAGYTGQRGFSLRDARFQRVLADAAKWRMATARAKVAEKKPLPPVMRPGVAGPRTTIHDAELSRLDKREFKDFRDAGRLLAARRRARGS
jgi:hypothetical protein